MSKKILKQKTMSFIIEDKEYNIIVSFKRVKRINLRINNSGVISASFPPNYREAGIKKFILSKSEWIKQNSEKIDSWQKKVDLHRKKRENTILIFGKLYDIIIVKSDKPGINLTTSALELKYPAPEHINVDETLKIWIKQFSRYHLRTIFYEIHERLRSYPLPSVQLQIRKKKRAWGSCYHARKLIILNSELIKAPKECIEMVIIHELVHLIHPNHGEKFYTLFSEFLPDWKERKKLLQEKMHLELDI